MNSGNIPEPPLRLAVLLSGSGSNLQALIDAIGNKQLPGVEIALVVSNNANAYGLQRALKHTLPTIYLPWNPQPNVGAQFIASTTTALQQPEMPVEAQFIAPDLYASNHPTPPAGATPDAQSIAPPDEVMPVGAQFIAPNLDAPEKGLMSASETRLTSLLHLFQIDFIVLAGWMRILSAPFLAQFPMRVINLHPALLPSNGTGSTYTARDGTELPVFRGLHAVRQALNASLRVTGSTVHYVTPEVDAGPVICQEEVIIELGDTEESLHERVKAVEHRLILEAIKKLNRKDSASK
jgi:folate-dependent phosphoribosylglycinamide formyltransferase PurN